MLLNSKRIIHVHSAKVRLRHGIRLVVLLLLFPENLSYSCEEESKSVKPNEEFIPTITQEEMTLTNKKIYVINKAMTYSAEFPEIQNGSFKINCDFNLLFNNYKAKFRYIINFIVKPAKIVERDEFRRSTLKMFSGEIKNGGKVARVNVFRKHYNHQIAWSGVIEPSPPNNATARRQFLQLLLTTPNNPLQLEIIITASKHCSPNAFTLACSDFNFKVCVHSSLLCDSYRNCPFNLNDDEDESKCRGSPPIFIIFIIVGVLVILFSAFIIQYILGHYIDTTTRTYLQRHRPNFNQPSPVPDITSTFLPKAPPPYDKKASKARPSGHDEPPTFDETIDPGVMPPMDFAKRYLGMRDIYTSSLQRGKPENFIPGSSPQKLLQCSEAFSSEESRRRLPSSNSQLDGSHGPHNTQQTTSASEQTHPEAPASEQTHPEAPASEQTHPEAPGS